MSRRVPEKNYEHRDVVDKLGIKAGSLVAFSAEPVEIDAVLRERILSRADEAADGSSELLDVVLAWLDDSSDPVEILRRWRLRLKPAGGIWLLTPKRNQPGYVNQQVLIDAGAMAGVVDNKVCSISPTMSAMRFVIRKRDRPQSR